MNIGLAVVLAPRFVETGMAWAVVASEAFVTTGVYWSVRRRGLDPIPYTLLQIGMIRAWGLPGAAWAWSLRVTLETLLLLWLANRVVRLPVPAVLGREFRRILIWVLLAAAGMWAVERELAGRIAAQMGLGGSCCVAWAG